MDDQNWLRKTSIVKFIFLLSCLISNATISNGQFTTNSTDQSITERTEKIITSPDLARKPIITQTIQPSEDLNYSIEKEIFGEDDFEDFETCENIKKPADNDDQRNDCRVVKGKSKLRYNDRDNSTSVYRPWTDGSVNTFQVLTELYNQHLWNIDNIANNVSKECGLEMHIYLDALKNEDEWAMKASDASGRYRGQFFFGNNYWVGSKALCYEINKERPSTVDRKQPVLKFHIAQIMLNLTITMKERLLQLAQCLPQSCTTNDIRNILISDPATYLLKSMSPYNQISFVNERSVPGEYDLWADQRFQLLASIFVIVGLLVVIGTIYELSTNSISVKLSKKDRLSDGISTQKNLNQKFINKEQLKLNQLPTDDKNCMTKTTAMGRDMEPSKQRNKTRTVGIPQQLLLCFSLLSNAKIIFSTKSLSQESVACIHGIKVFSMVWLTIAHGGFSLSYQTENIGQIIILKRLFIFQIIGNAVFIVDTLYFVSGLLVTLLFLQNIDKVKSTTKSIISDTKMFFFSYFYRYLRLTPVYFVTLLLTEVSLKYIYNDSALPILERSDLTCPNYWWRNMLYIQNWFPMGEYCMVWSYYLANEMQLYVWAILILILSTRYFKISVAIMFAFLLVSWLITAIVSLNNNYTFSIFDTLASYGFLYDQVFLRTGPYIMGMIAGYIINRFKEPPKISFAFNIFMWIISMVTLLLCLFGVWNHVLDTTATAFYMTFARTAWGFGLIWVILSCEWGLARPVDKILSYSGFLPFSRLTYCTYLITGPIVLTTINQMQGPFHVQMLVTAFFALGYVVISYPCAFIVSVMFEVPAVRILKILSKK